MGLKFRCLLAYLLIFSLLALPTLAALPFPDVDEGANYAEAVEFLVNAKIMTGDDKGSFNPKSPVTRAEMAVIVCRMLGEAQNLTVANKFSDVPISHWANKYVARAAELGIIQGYNAERFGPDDAVIFEQAVTMLVRTIGLDGEAKQKGGYPEGYISVGQNLGLLSNLSAKMGNHLSRANTAIMVFNCSEARRLFNETYWSISYGYTNGSQYAGLFHLDMTCSAVQSNGGNFTTTFSYRDGILTFDGVDYRKDSNGGFVSVDKFAMQGDYMDNRHILPDPGKRYLDVVGSDHYKEQNYNGQNRLVSIPNMQSGPGSGLLADGEYLVHLGNQIKTDPNGNETVLADIPVPIVLSDSFVKSLHKKDTIDLSQINLEWTGTGYKIEVNKLEKGNYNSIWINDYIYLEPCENGWLIQEEDDIGSFPIKYIAEHKDITLTANTVIIDTYTSIEMYGIYEECQIENLQSFFDRWGGGHPARITVRSGEIVKMNLFYYIN